MSPNPCPQRVLASSLSSGAQLFVFSVRHWLIAANSKQCIHERLEPFYASMNAAPAVAVLDELMCFIAATAFRKLQIHCPCRADLGDDELALLQILQAVQRGDDQCALDAADTLFTGTFRLSFLRIARAYLAELKAASLSVTGVRYLCAVPDTPPPMAPAH